MIEQLLQERFVHANLSLPQPRRLPHHDRRWYAIISDGAPCEQNMFLSSAEYVRLTGGALSELNAIVVGQGQLEAAVAASEADGHTAPCAAALCMQGRRTVHRLRELHRGW